MIWKYAKENEVYVVEPTGFTTTRDSGNPLGYSYNITLRTLYKFDSKPTFPKDDLNALQSITAGIGFVQDAIRDLSRGLAQLGKAIDFLEQLPTRVFDLVVDGALTMLSALVQIKDLGQQALSAGVGTGGFGPSLLKSFEEAADNLAQTGSILIDGLELGDKRVFGSSSTPAVVGVESIPFITAAATLPILRNEAIRAARLFARTANQLRAQDHLWKQNKKVSVADIGSAYSKDGQGLPFASSSPLNPRNINIPSSAREETILGDETIRGFAKRTMGDASYWKTIAILNDLKSPYISDTGGNGVKSRNEVLLVPQAGNDSDFPSVDENQDTATSLSPVMSSFGRDLMLTNVTASEGMADVAIDQSGDLALIEGVPNVQQAVSIKFSTEEKELPIHPFFGAAFPIGTKVHINQIQDFSMGTRSTLLSDARVKSVYKLRVFANGDVIQVNARVKLRQIDASFPVDFAVRRF
ncbi:MAG: hypothetical protein DRP42_07295 [Tenericutes bacterium]|nr:MAG: hypothetical protein DRP42_07295 [Mycoplasmatota bacterium]